MAKKKAVPEANKELAARREAYDWILSIITALIICIFAFLCVIRVVDVSGDSMYPTLINEEKMLVSGLFYHPKPGDIVIFKTNYDNEEKDLVKRVIAVGGQEVKIDFDKGIVYVDEVPEEYVDVPTTMRHQFQGPWKVPEGFVFVLGDNRNQSTDSRDKRIGNVDEREIIGKVYAVIYPFENIRKIG